MRNDVLAAFGLRDYFTTDHRACDELWATVEEIVSNGGFIEAVLDAFSQAMRRHLEMEEQVLFPAFEEATGTSGGPTMVMRLEHEQMRGLLDQMNRSAQQQRWDTLLDQGDTLLMLVQQHNLKEEGMFYPMCERRLGASWSDLATRLAQI